MKKKEQTLKRINSLFSLSRFGLISGVLVKYIIEFAGIFAIVFIIFTGLSFLISSKNLSILSISISSLIILFFIIYIYIKRNLFNISKSWRYIEKKSSLTEGRLEGIIQLYRENRDTDLSRGLLNKALLNISEKIKITFPFFKQFSKIHLLFIIPLLLILIISVINQDILATTTKMILQPIFGTGTDKLVIDVEPGDTTIYRGESVLIEVVIKNAYIPPTLELKNSTDKEIKSMELITPGHYSLTLDKLLEDTEYRIKVSNNKTRWFKIDTVQKLELLSQETTITPPDYSKLSKTKATGYISKSVLPGSLINILIHIKGDLKDVNLSGIETTVDMNKDGDVNHLKASFNIYTPAEISLTCSDELGKEYNFGEILSLDLLQDKPPSIKLVSPTMDIALSKSLKLPFKAEVSDDYGVSYITLEYENLSTIEEGSARVMELPQRPTQGLADFVFDFREVDPLPGDILKVYLKCYDNDTVNGPKSSKSKSIQIVVPDIEELFAFQYDETRESGISSEELSEIGKSIEQTLIEIEEKLESKESLDYSSYQKLEEIKQREKELVESAEELKKMIEDSMGDSEDTYLSLETVHKLSELNQRLNEVFGERMKEMMENIQKAMESVDKEDIKKHLTKALEKQKYLGEQIEEMLSLLEVIQQEAKLDSLIEKSRKLKEKQENVLKNYREDKTSPDIMKDEKDINSALKKLMEEMEKFKSELKEEPSEKFDKKFSKSFKNELMKNSMDTIDKLSLDEDAYKDMKKLLESLKELNSNLQNFQQEYYSSEKQRIMSEMESAITEIGEMSRLLDMMKNTLDNNNSLDEINCQMESGLNELKKKLSDISKETLFMGNKPENLLNQTIETLSSLSSGDKDLQEQLSGASEKLAEAMAYVEMAKQGLKGSSSPSGLQDLLSALSQISQGQLALGNSLLDMLMGSDGNLTQEQLAELAAQQLALKNALSQLMQKYKGIEQLTEDLSGALEAMEKIENMLNEGLDSERIKEEQVHLMEVLLRTSHALKSKGISHKRKSEPGKFYPNPNIPKNLPSGIDIIPEKDNIPGGIDKTYETYIELNNYIREYLINISQ
jgi:hypothetical protein